MSADYLLRLGSDESERYGEMAARARRQEAEQWVAAGVVPGARVADLGCGPGAVLIELATLVGGRGRVDGVDRDPVAVDQARAALSEAGLANAAASVGDAAVSGLDAGSYDVVMVRHVLAHNAATPCDVVRHAVSLLLPGGRLYLADADVCAVRMVPGDPDLADEARRYTDLLVRRGGDPQMGPRLAEVLLVCGLRVVDFGGRYDVLWRDHFFGFGPARAARSALLESGLATEDDARRWDAAGARYLGQGCHKYIVVPIFYAVGAPS